MAIENPGQTHYSAALAPFAKFGAMQGDISTRTCVIGAGFAGLTCARELARCGHEVVLLEAQSIGWGASGRNGGFVSSGFARDPASIAASIGWQPTQDLMAMSAMGRDYVYEAITELKLEDAILGRRWLKLLRHPRIEELQQFQAMMEDKFSQKLRFIEKSEVKHFLDSPSYHAGLLDKKAFHIQPLQYAYALAHDICHHGGTVFENARCTGLENLSNAHKPKWRVNTARGSIEAEHVVLATSAYGGPYAPLNRAIIPVATYVVSSQPNGALLDNAIAFKGCISDLRRSGDYYRTIGKGENRRLIWGGRITTMKTRPRRLASLLKRDITNVYPQLAGLKLEHAWSGLMGYAIHKMPIIGPLEPGLWSATAFGGQGLNTSAMAGVLVSSAINKGDKRYQQFSFFGPKWSGGALGNVFTQLEYWRLQFLDGIDESR